MATHARMRGSHAILATGRAAQAGWLLFVLLALSLALPGIAPYSRLLQTVCNSADCLIGQLTPAEAQAALASGFSLPEYADVAIIIYLFACAFLLLTAVALIWRKPSHGAAVCGAFALAALATGDLERLSPEIDSLREELHELLLPRDPLDGREPGDGGGHPGARFRPSEARDPALDLSLRGAGTRDAFAP